MSMARVRVYRSGCGASLVVGGPLPMLLPPTWTDGYVPFSDQRYDDQVLRCKSCNELIWVEGAVFEHEMDRPTPDALPRINQLLKESAVAPLELAHYERALRSAPSDRASAHARRRIWQLRNHPLREAGGSGVHDAEARANMEALLALLSDSAVLDRVELLRELGRWDEAKALLVGFEPLDAVDVPRVLAIARGIEEQRVVPLAADVQVRSKSESDWLRWIKRFFHAGPPAK